IQNRENITSSAEERPSSHLRRFAVDLKTQLRHDRLLCIVQSSPVPLRFRWPPYRPSSSNGNRPCHAPLAADEGSGWSCLSSLEFRRIRFRISCLAPIFSAHASR